MRQLLLLLLLPFSTWTKAIRSATEESGEEDSPIKLDEDNFVLREDHRLMIACVYGADDIASMSDLKWTTAGGQPIDGESSSSVFTVGLHEHGTNHKKKTLHFTEIKKRDSGDYICEAKGGDGKVYKKTVHITVLDKIEWDSDETQVGGLVGEPLTVDCGAKADPEPMIQITDANGEPLKESLFNIAGNEVSVASLTKEYNGLVVNCVALQILPDLDTTSTEQRAVHIDAWFAPEFESDRIDRHTILHRTAILPCNVTESNPPARHFNFFRNNVLLDNEEKYQLVMDVLENAAYLKVHNVEESDLGEYQCEVNNGRAKATQTINLKEANPPDEVRVSLEQVKKHGIVWKIVTDEEDPLPATKVEIQYIRKEIIKEEAEKGEEDTEAVWHGKASKTTRSISESNLYDIGGLRANTEYSFRFRAESEAGYGPTIELDASTNHELNTTPTPEEDSSSISFSLSTVLSLILLRILL